jgi:phage-related minor tail protein
MELKQISEYALKQTGVREAAAEWDALDAAQRRAASGGDVLTKQVEVQEKAVTRIGSKLNTLANSELTAVEKAYQRVERAEALEAAAKKNGLALTDSQILGIQRVRQRYEELSRGVNDNSKLIGAHADHVGFASHQWLNLNRQLQDAGTMLAMGSSPMQVLTSQGAQIYDVFASSRGGAAAGLREFGSVVAGAITPTRVLGAAVVGAAGVSVAALARWKSASDELQQSLDGLGRFSGVSFTGARGLAESAAAQSGLSLRSSSRIVAGGLSAGLDAASAGGVAGLAKDFSVKLGIGLDDVAKELTGAFADPAKGAEELARKYGLVSLAQAHHIEELVKVGDRSGAAAELSARTASARCWTISA